MTYDSKFACLPSGTGDESSVIAQIQRNPHIRFERPPSYVSPEAMRLIRFGVALVIAGLIGCAFIPLVKPEGGWFRVPTVTNPLPSQAEIERKVTSTIVGKP